MHSVTVRTRADSRLESGGLHYFSPTPCGSHACLSYSGLIARSRDAPQCTNSEYLGGGLVIIPFTNGRICRSSEQLVEEFHRTHLACAFRTSHYVRQAACPSNSSDACRPGRVIVCHAIDRTAVSMRTFVSNHKVEMNQKNITTSKLRVVSYNMLFKLVSVELYNCEIRGISRIKIEIDGQR